MNEFIHFASGINYEACCGSSMLNTSFYFEEISCQDCLKSDYYISNLKEHENRSIDSLAGLFSLLGRIQNISSPEFFIKLAKTLYNFEKQFSLHIDPNQLKVISEQEFILNWLHKKYSNDVCILSGNFEIHPCFKALISLKSDPETIKFLFSKLNERKSFCNISLLDSIFENDGPKFEKNDAGKTKIVANKWLQWGREKGYIDF